MGAEGKGYVPAWPSTPSPWNVCAAASIPPPSLTPGISRGEGDASSPGCAGCSPQSGTCTLPGMPSAHVSAPSLPGGTAGLHRSDSASCHRAFATGSRFSLSVRTHVESWTRPREVPSSPVSLLMLLAPCYGALRGIGRWSQPRLGVVPMPLLGPKLEVFG